MQSTQNAPQMCSLCREHSEHTKPFKQGVICEDCSVDLSFGGGGGGGGSGTGSGTGATTSPPLPTPGAAPGSPPQQTTPSLFVAGVGPKLVPRPPRALAAPVLTTASPAHPPRPAHPAPSVFYGTMMAPTPPPPQFHHPYHHHGQQAQHLMATAAAAQQRHTMMHRHTTTTRAHFGPRPGATMPLASGATHATARVSKTPSPPPGLLPRRATPSPTSRFPSPPHRTTTPAPAPAPTTGSSSSRDTRCDWRHRCKFGVDCMFLHSPDEMAYFREHGGVGNPVWKTKTCVNWKPHEAASCDFYHPGTDPVWCEHVGPNTGGSSSNTGSGSGAGSGSAGPARASTSAGRTVCRTAGTGSPPRTFGGATAASQQHQRMVRPQRVPRWPAPTGGLLGAASAAMAAPHTYHSTSSSASALRGRADLKSNWRQRGSPTVATSPTVQIAA